MSIEEKLSKSILYNLNILKNAVKTSEQLDEVLTEGIFLKSNTQAFIHVTYYLFNILDSKEFRKKFYWPIVDKKSENAYRTSSVEFINILIDKHNLSQERIKLVTVVHPSGKKFMSLILDLILIAIKEVMKRKKFNSSKSLDIDSALEIATTINQIESDLMSSLRSELKVIKDKMQDIQELVNRIYPAGDNIDSFDDFIAAWHDLNLTRMSTIKANESKIRDIFRKTKSLQVRSESMMADKKYEIHQPSSSDIKELTEFYQHIEVPIDNKLNIVSLIIYLQSSLPIILNYIENFSYDEAEVSHEEMKIVRQEIVELEKFDPMIRKLGEREEALKEKIVRMKAERDEEFIMSDDIDDVGEAEEQAVLRVMLSPRYQFDGSKSCTSNVIHKRNHLVFSENDENADRINSTKFLRPYASESKLNKTNREMLPPKQMQLPSRRRRQRDAMKLLEQATTNNRNIDMNSTRYTGAIPKYPTSPTAFSSTFLSPDLIHNVNPNFSTISSIVFTPIPHPKESIKPDVLTNGENHQSKKLQRSSAKIVDSFEDSLQSPKLPPKIQLNDETVKSSSSPSITNGHPFSGEMECTVCEKENFGCELSNNDDTILFKKKTFDDEDLFNISDSILVND